MGATIKDVARVASVSIATVSRILNNQPGYSEETKRKVMKAIKELGYQPNAVARGLINKKTQTIGVLFPDISSMLSSAILGGIEEVTHEHGNSVIVCHTAAQGNKTMKYIQLLREKRVDAILWVSEAMREEYYEVLLDMNIPVVLISTESNRFQFPYVKVSDKSASFSATEYMIKNGHQKIGMISGPKEDLISGFPRYEGYKLALHEYGIEMKEERVVFSNGFDYDAGKESFKKLINHSPEITGVVVASDEMAMGAIVAAYRLGIDVPDDLSIIGYDNLKLAEMAVPPLTTVAQPLHELGQTGAEMLFKMIETGEKARNIILPHSIIERDSVRPL
ncbi:LacI family DNA-binding transcriptional regulator [Caldalkalibacillus salinus]|uniref:LacI family DNA-binding transcriptional regulator n=1 Tax=Caldalkalibacillus salinus TaxID=2803787 RepID=UPI0019215FD1|nr:LacI family DNA-binding transcriptional regulator [Caldalkalibacillus salinus]